MATSTNLPVRHECLLMRAANSIIVASSLFLPIIGHLWFAQLVMDLQYSSLLALGDHLRVLIAISTTRTCRSHLVALAAAVDFTSSRSLSLRSLSSPTNCSILQAGATDNVLLARCDIDDRL